MIDRKWAGTLAAVLALFFVAVTSARATTIRGGSNYGDSESSCVTAVEDGPSSSSFENCEYSTPTTFTIGGTTYSGDVFYYVQNATDYGAVDVINTGATDFTLNLVNTSLETGVLTCGSESDPSGGSSSANSATDSGGTLMNLACMPGDSAAGVTQTPTSTGFTFASSSADLVVYTADGNISGVTPTPEPSSLMLFGVGLVALAGLALKTR
jgi:hypothetical protein